MTQETTQASVPLSEWDPFVHGNMTHQQTLEACDEWEECGSLGWSTGNGLSHYFEWHGIDSGGKEMDAIRAEINEVVESGRCGCSECPDKETNPCKK